MFIHTDLKLPDIAFSSPLTDLVIALEQSRDRQVAGSTHPLLFSQMKQIFHMLESIGSARIEGNNTTIAEYIETRLDNRAELSPDIREIMNLENTMIYIEENRDKIVFEKGFITRLYEMITEGLPSEIGVELRGEYRKHNVSIRGVVHNPPGYSQVDAYMQELLDFINHTDSPKYDLIKTAIAHHRFVWIHPFDDGNGRTVRMLTYAMLIRAGFGSGSSRIINPTAVFCSDRKAYYKHLAGADTGLEEGLINWCLYVLNGLKSEMVKIERLLDYACLKKDILLPALIYSKERQLISPLETNILRRAAEKQVIQAGDIREYFQGKDNAIISRQIKKLIDRKMLIPEQEGARKYLISFNNNYLLRGIVKSLGDNDFLPVKY